MESAIHHELTFLRSKSRILWVHSNQQAIRGWPSSIFPACDQFYETVYQRLVQAESANMLI